MPTTLYISRELALSAEAVTETFGIPAVRGAGKSNAAAVMAEEMFKARLPFVVVDPVRAWWGLRASRDGTGPGLPIPIFGGTRGDTGPQDVASIEAWLRYHQQSREILASLPGLQDGKA
jgi:DNA helicase HerA-like ATPase